MSKNTLDIAKLCRICACESESISVFSEESKHIYLQTKMKKYLNITVSSEDVLPKVICTNCSKKLENIHRFASMALKTQEKLSSLLENPDKPIRPSPNLSKEAICDETQNARNKEHSILHSILTKGSDQESEVTEVEVRVDPMLFLCALEDGSTSDNDDADSLGQERLGPNPTPTTDTEAVLMKVKPYKCSICLRGFNNEIGLQNHLWSHLPRGKKLLSNSDNLHLQRQPSVYSSRGVLHTNPESLRFVCPICGKKISTKGNLKVHLETHRPKGKYGCDICGRVFKTQPNLYRHKDYHGGVQYPCNVCGRVYPTNSTLRAHSITHSDLRPHACPLCDKTFKRNQDLKFHINQHTGARPYQCPYCPKAFASSGNCFSHRKRMHPQEVERDRERANQIMR